MEPTMHLTSKKCIPFIHTWFWLYCKWERCFGWWKIWQKRKR